MTANFSITIKNDEEGMFGAEGPAGIDVDATIEAYNIAVLKQIRDVYPANDWK